MEDDYKLCPYCAERIREAATICRYCNRSLTEPVDSSRNHRWLAVVAAGLLALVVVALAVYSSVRKWVPTSFRQNPPSASAQTSPTLTVQTDSVASQPPPPPPQPVPVAQFVPIVQGNIVVPPQRIQYFKFIVPQVAQDAKVRGVFHAFGGAGNDIEAAIMTPFEFENWSNGHEAHVYYNSGKVTNGQIQVDGIPPGTYILAFSNRFAMLSRKEVTAQVSLSYTVLERQ
jgi:hypothetical protein